jgi:hypothetical protein
VIDDFIERTVPQIGALRRNREAREARERDELATRTIFTDGRMPTLNITEAIITGRGGWVDAAFTAAEKEAKAAREKAARESEELSVCPEPEF